MTGVFGIIGIAGTISAGISGRLASGKYIKLWNLGAILAIGLVFILLKFNWENVYFLVLITFILDIASRINTTVNQARNYTLSIENHSRINSLYMVFYFLGGSLGTFTGSFMYEQYQINEIVILGIVFTSITICYSFVDKLSKIRMVI